MLYDQFVCFWLYISITTIAYKNYSRFWMRKSENNFVGIAIVMTYQWFTLIDGEKSLNDNLQRGLGQ